MDVIKDNVSKKMVVVTTGLTLISQTENMTKAIIIGALCAAYVLGQSFVDGKKSEGK